MPGIRNRPESKSSHGTVPFRKAIDVIAEISARKDASFAKSPQFQAVATHWLQNVGIRPPLLPSSVWRIRDALPAAIAACTPSSDRVVRDHEAQLCLDFSDLPYPPPEKGAFTFIDLFAGIGGFRLAMQAAGGKCVFSCEWDKYAQQTYAANFGEVPYGDIRKIDEREIPDHTVLCAGFPCQPFSLAGVSKKNSMGRKHGFQDETQGTLFFEIARILRHKRPPAFFLENVKNLLRHDSCTTFETIRRTLEDELGYVVKHELVDGANWAPQHRERVFIVGYDPKQVQVDKKDIDIPVKPPEGFRRTELADIILPCVAPSYTLGPGTWATLERHKAHHADAGNGFGYSMHELPIPPGAVTRTISARYHKDGAEILIAQKGRLPRKLTVEEAAQLQGYDPRRYVFPVSHTQAYKQIGNSVVVPAIAATAAEIARVLAEHCK